MASLDQHGGSPARLLLLLLEASPLFLSVLLLLYTRLPTAWSLAAQTLLALNSVSESVR